MMKCSPFQQDLHSFVLRFDQKFEENLGFNGKDRVSGLLEERCSYYFLLMTTCTDACTNKMEINQDEADFW